ncbi:hypothetical protein V8G54_010635 [Vigna mungo]|uniref:Uncharacterized protein n=1 Tax=Vigna mungo TaxID=3915 RepID=A0AAQ3NXW9_VIGMU
MTIARSIPPFINFSVSGSFFFCTFSDTLSEKVTRSFFTDFQPPISTSGATAARKLVFASFLARGCRFFGVITCLLKFFKDKDGGAIFFWLKLLRLEEIPCISFVMLQRSFFTLCIEASISRGNGETAKYTSCSFSFFETWLICSDKDFKFPSIIALNSSCPLV